MATTYKTLLDDDIVSTKTLLHENIPITGSIISSSVYLSSNIKSYSHGMFQTVHDYPYLSSSANQLFDITAGAVSGSPGSTYQNPFNVKKTNLYNQMAQVLVGYDPTGSILKFDRDGDSATAAASEKFNSMFFLNFSRLLVKDEIKKGTFILDIGINSSSISPFWCTGRVWDASGSTNYKTNSPTGEYGILYADTYTSGGATTPENSVGLIFYQAGVVALSPSIFAASGVLPPGVSGTLSQSVQGQISQAQGQLSMLGTGSTFTNIEHLFNSGTVEDASAALRNRIKNITFNNTTELNSTIHFCRVGHNDFNYSSNPSYLSASQIRVKNKTSDAPISYITTVGLYSPDNELLAVAKLSEPLKKTPEEELILRTRLDF